jgi:O-antigen/teichoic acid export membrane protein
MAYGYVLMFATCLAYFGGVSLVFSLQAVATTDWNAVRIFQPVAFAVIVWALYAFGVLTLIACLSAISVTILAQTVLAYVLAGRNGLLGGSADYASTKAMSRYGLHQLAGAAPGVLIIQLDQLALSVTVKPQALGHYAAATSLTSLALPAASALGSVVFPRIALQYKRDQSGTDRLQRQVLVVTIVLSFAVMAALMLSAKWTVPLVFGEDYRAAIPLVWILAPGMALFAFSQICADMLRGYGQPLIIAKVQWVAAGASVVAMAVLLPTFGATGAALATLGSSAVAAAGIGWAMRRRGLAQRTQAASDERENE